MKNWSKLRVVIERDEDGYYVATVPALHGAHTQGKTLGVLMKRLGEVLQLCTEEHPCFLEGRLKRVSDLP